MTNVDLRCDGCGQPASPEHTARRLQRLEWATCFRPVHIGTLLLGAVAPRSDSEFLYSPAGDWDGEARTLLAAAGITPDGKSAEAVLAEFQRGGFFLAHVLECPLERQDESAAQQLIASRLPRVLTRIRRSLKPKRLALISSRLQEFLPGFASGQLPCTLLQDGRPFALDGDQSAVAVGRLTEALAVRGSRAAG